jgi:hypothetical protein
MDERFAIGQPYLESELTPSIMNKPAWLVLATQTKARIDRLSNRKTFPKRRREIVERSHDIARDKYNYPGTLLDWVSIVESVGNGKQK